MSITTDRKASVSLNEQEVVDRLFPFFEKGVRKGVVTRRLNNGGLAFTFTDATDEVVKLLKENFAEKEKKTKTSSRKPMIDKETLLKRNTWEIGFNSRTVNCLKAAEINTVADLTKYHPRTLIRFRNFGKKGIAELEEFMKRHDLSWTEEPETP